MSPPSLGFADTPPTVTSSAASLSHISHGSSYTTSTQKGAVATVVSAAPVARLGATSRSGSGGGSYSAMFAAAAAAPRPGGSIVPLPPGSRFDLDPSGGFDNVAAPLVGQVRPPPIPPSKSSASGLSTGPAIAAFSRSELSSKLPPTAAPNEATTSQPALVLPLSRANLQYVVEMLGCVSDRSAQMKGLHFFGRSADIQACTDLNTHAF